MTALENFYAAMADGRSLLLWTSLVVLSVAAVGFSCLLIYRVFFAKNAEGNAS